MARSLLGNPCWRQTARVDSDRPDIHRDMWGHSAGRDWDAVMAAHPQHWHMDVNAHGWSTKLHSLLSGSSEVDKETPTPQKRTNTFPAPEILLFYRSAFCMHWTENYEAHSFRWLKVECSLENKTKPKIKWVDRKIKIYIYNLKKTKLIETL